MHRHKKETMNGRGDIWKREGDDRRAGGEAQMNQAWIKSEKGECVCLGGWGGRK